MRREEGGVGSLNILEGVFNWALRVAGLLLVAITGYYVYWSYASGQGGAAVLTAVEYARHQQNMDLLTKLLLVATVTAAVAAIGRYYAGVHESAWPVITSPVFSELMFDFYSIGQRQ